MLGCGVWGLGGGGLGFGDWGWAPTPNPQSPIPNPQSPSPKLIYIKDNLLNIIKEFIIIKIKWKIVVHPKKIKKL